MNVLKVRDDYPWSLAAEVKTAIESEEDFETATDFIFNYLSFIISKMSKTNKLKLSKVAYQKGDILYVISTAKVDEDFEELRGFSRLYVGKIKEILDTYDQIFNFFTVLFPDQVAEYIKHTAPGTLRYFCKVYDKFDDMEEISRFDFSSSVVRLFLHCDKYVLVVGTALAPVGNILSEFYFDSIPYRRLGLFQKELSIKALELL